MLIDESRRISPLLAGWVTEDSPISYPKCGPLFKDSHRADFWFKDGNVILLAGSVAFKVQRGVIERHSDVFRDILSIPQPLEEETFEDCHIVEIYDEPADLWCLLKALYDGL